MVDAEDATVWCTPGVDGARVGSQLDRLTLAGDSTEVVSTPEAAQRIRVQCFADASLTGDSVVVTSAWSGDEGQHRLELRCPSAKPVASFVQCQLAASGKPPFVYAGPTCGDGLASVAKPPSLQGQLLGDHYELGSPAKPLFNDTGAAGVVGTDLGYPFLSQGKMYLGFGDTWQNDLSLPGSAGYRGSILAHTHDFDPTDGIRFEGWEESASAPGIAREIIPSPHDQTSRTEFTAIATAGFGLSEGDAHYRFLWFAAIKGWSPFVTNESTLAWSKNGADFVRGDRVAGSHVARWPFETYFGPGAVWVDREHGYVYFYGVRTYQAGFPIRVARVRATVAAVQDHLQYEYWTGAGWQRPDPADEYALARLDDHAADLVPGSASQNNRPEFSVTYNPYLGRFTMIVHNDATPFADEPTTYLQLWEAEAPEGPWTRADVGNALDLPPHLYGPYLSEQTLSDGGRGVHFVLSDWDVSQMLFGQPYVVGLWQMTLERKLRPGCAP